MIKYNSLMKEKLSRIKDLSSTEIKGELSVLWPEFYENSGFYFMRICAGEKYENLDRDREGDITMRFFKYREDEPTWLDEDNLESYESEAICVRIVGEKETDD